MDTAWTDRCGLYTIASTNSYMAEAKAASTRSMVGYILVGVYGEERKYAVDVTELPSAGDNLSGGYIGELIAMVAAIESGVLAYMDVGTEDTVLVESTA